MRNIIIFLIVVVLLYLIPSLILQAVYGPSYGFLSGENHWVPDGYGGWQKQGEPTELPPTIPSVNVPLWAKYIPLFLPGFLVILFIFTPLSKLLENKSSEEMEDKTDELEI